MIKNEKYIVYHSSEYAPLEDDGRDARDPDPKVIASPKKYSLWETLLGMLVHKIAGFFLG